MSSAASPSGPQLRDRVLNMAREIEKLSTAKVPPPEFFQKFLQTLVGAMSAKAGVVWMLQDGAQLAPVCQVNYPALGIQGNPEAERRNRQLLVDVLSTGEARAIAPDDSDDTQLPSHHLIILAALQCETDCVGVVEIFQRVDAPVEARAGFLQFVEQMTGYASRYLELQRAAAEPQSPTRFWEELERLLLQLQRARKVKEVAATAANDGRLLLGCDRMSVVRARGRKVIVEAVSGLDSVNPRANLVRRMRDLAREAMAGREPVAYGGKAEPVPPQLEEPLAKFIEEGRARTLLIVPLLEPPPLVRRSEKDEQDAAERRREEEKRRKPIGCLVIEQMRSGLPMPDRTERAQLLADHVSAALVNARGYERIFLLPVWELLGRTREWFYGRKLAKLIAAVVIIAAVSCAMAFVPWDYRVEGEGRLMPVVQRQVFAPWDGEVEEIFVKGGDRVAAGDKLLRIRDHQLENDLVAAQKELEQHRAQARTLQPEIDRASRTGRAEEAHKLEGELTAAQVQIEGLTEQIRILAERKDQLTVTAPIDGVVATFQLEQLLPERPVARGDLLLEVMDDTGDWRLELEVEEHRMGHVLRAQKDRGEHLPVEFILATAPEKTFKGTLDAMATRSNTSAERGSIVQVYVATDAEKLPKRIGADVEAKINCGERALGYVLFGDVVEFVQRYFWL